MRHKRAQGVGESGESERCLRSEMIDDFVVVSRVRGKKVKLNNYPGTQPHADKRDKLTFIHVCRADIPNTYFSCIGDGILYASTYMPIPRGTEYGG